MHAQGPATRDGAPVRQAIAIAAVAIGAAGFAIVFRGLLKAAYRALGTVDVVAVFQGLPLAARALLPALGGLLAGLVVQASAPRVRPQGVGDVMEAVAFGHVRLSMRTTLSKSVACFAAIALGGSLGREGPLIQFGGTLGDAVGRAFRLDERRVRALMAAGTAAGFAAAYNTPIAALLFVLEVVSGVVALEVTVGAALAVAVATGVSRFAGSPEPIYGQRSFAMVSVFELGAYLPLGLLGGAAGIAFMRILERGEAAFASLRLAQPWRAALGGLLVGLVALAVPEVTGNGYEPLNALLDGALPIGAVIGLALLKPLTTAASVGSGSPGGVFTPTLLVGAAVGVTLQALMARALGLHVAGPGAYALVGMAAATAATTHAPLMATVLVFELSGDYAIVLPLLVATATATLVARGLGRDSLYGAELRRKGVRWEVTIDGRQRAPTDP